MCHVSLAVSVRLVACDSVQCVSVSINVTLIGCDNVSCVARYQCEANGL